MQEGRARCPLHRRQPAREGGAGGVNVLGTMAKLLMSEVALIQAASHALAAGRSQGPETRGCGRPSSTQRSISVSSSVAASPISYTPNRAGGFHLTGSTGGQCRPAGGVSGRAVRVRVAACFKRGACMCTHRAGQENAGGGGGQGEEIDRRR